MKYIFPIVLIGILFANCGKDDDISGTEQEIIDRYIASNSLVTQMTSSGLLYVIDEVGTGDQPTGDQVVVLNVKEYFLNGDLIFETDGSPFVSELSGLFPGLRESVELLKKGGKGSFIIPSSLAFGANGAGNIPPNSPLLFELELLDVQADLLTYETSLFEAYLSANNLTAQTTSTGLQYIIEEPGSGGNPSATSQVQVNYKGYFLNGEVFDQSNGTPLSIGLANVIKGWTEGIPLFQKGGKGVLLVPSNLAYGVNGSGSIGPNTPILFDVELVDFN